MTWPCVLAHRFEPDRPRRPVEGLLVCRGCLSRLEQALAEIPAQHRALTFALSVAMGGARVSGTPDARLPINPAAAEVESDILWKLVSWVRLIAEERRLATPTCNDVGVLSCWLLVHLRWSCAQDWVVDYAHELLGYESEAFARWVPGLRGRAHALLYPSGRRKMTVGGCVEQGCPGELVATVAQVDDLLPPSIDCTEDPAHSWPADRWSVLGRRLHGAAGYEARAAAAFLDLISGRMSA